MSDIDKVAKTVANAYKWQIISFEEKIEQYAKHNTDYISMLRVRDFCKKDVPNELKVIFDYITAVCIDKYKICH